MFNILKKIQKKGEILNNKFDGLGKYYQYNENGALENIFEGQLKIKKNCT